MNKNISNLLKYKSWWLAIIVLLMALIPRVTTLSHTFIVNDGIGTGQQIANVAEYVFQTFITGTDKKKQTTD